MHHFGPTKRHSTFSRSAITMARTKITKKTTTNRTDATQVSAAATHKLASTTRPCATKSTFQIGKWIGGEGPAAARYSPVESQLLTDEADGSRGDFTSGVYSTQHGARSLSASFIIHWAIFLYAAHLFTCLPEAKKGGLLLAPFNSGCRGHLATTDATTYFVYAHQ